jgi:sortase A
MSGWRRQRTGRGGWRDAITWGLLLIGVLILGEGLAMGAKAKLGQWLIQQAWQTKQRGEEAAPPWPWADTRPVARLEVPAHGVDLIVLAGGTGHTLAWGPGHLAGTAPVGAPGNSVIGGHRDTHFSFLRGIETGAEIRTESADGRNRVYHVIDRYVTHERDAQVLAPSDDAQLTLVTCWPFDTPVPGGPERYVVVAR